MSAKVNAIEVEESTEREAREVSSPEDRIFPLSSPLASADSLASPIADNETETSFSRALLGGNPRYQWVESAQTEDSDQRSGPGQIQSTPRRRTSAVSETEGNLGGPRQGLLPSSSPSAAAGMSPLLTGGIFPYQLNPIGALLSAGLTMAVMSLRETGKVDVQSILFLLNSTDFYIGLLGSANGAFGQKATGGLVEAIGRGAMKAAPEMLKPLVAQEAIQVVSKIIAGFSYTFSVSAGYEVFSQFWKIATKNIPEAHSMTDFVASPMTVKKQVMMNLMYHTLLDGNLQKRIFDSVYNHRILTFEFIAMNIGLYVGAQLGTLIAAEYAPGNPWSKPLGSIAGGVTGGLLVQLMPDSWKSYFNYGLLDYKIGVQENKLQRLYQTVGRNLEDEIYPPWSGDPIAFFTPGYWMSGATLNHDLERIFGTQELLNTLYFQQAGLGNAAATSSWIDAANAADSVVSFFELAKEEVEKPQPTLSEQLSQWVDEDRPVQEIRGLSTAHHEAEPRRVYYQQMIDYGLERAKESQMELDQLQQMLMRAEPVNVDLISPSVSDSIAEPAALQ